MGFLTQNGKKYFFVATMAFQVVVCSGYFYLSSGKDAFPAFLALYSMQFAAFVLGAWVLRSLIICDLSWIVGIAICARAILLFSEPALENDYFRYLWDGRVLAHGINPYQYKPLDPALDHLDVSYRHQIGWKEYGTIYPPISIGVFAISHLIAPDSLWALKVILLLFDLGTGWLIIEWLKTLNVAVKWSFLYFLNPLVLKEVANSAHLDTIAVFFSTLAALLLSKSEKSPDGAKKSLAAWIALAFAVASKLYPICFLPLFLKGDRRRWMGLAVFLLILVALYYPILSLGTPAWNGTEAFARHWIFNASIYRVFQKACNHLFEFLSTRQPIWASLMISLFRDELLAKGMSGLALAVFAITRARRMETLRCLPKEMAFVIGALLLLSPVVNAWYVLWLLPFACVDRNTLWLIFSYLVVASYSWWYSPEVAFYLRWAEYVVFFLLLGFWNKRKTVLERLS